MGMRVDVQWLTQFEIRCRPRRVMTYLLVRGLRAAIATATIHQRVLQREERRTLATVGPLMMSHLYSVQLEECCMLLRATLSCLSASLRPISVKLVSSKNKRVCKIEPKLAWKPRTADTSTTSGRFIVGTILTDVEFFPCLRMSFAQMFRLSALSRLIRGVGLSDGGLRASSAASSSRCLPLSSVGLSELWAEAH